MKALACTLATHPLESLRRDHRLLLQLTDALDAYGAMLIAGGRGRPGDLRALTRALRSVADYRHFEKEEQVLEQVLVRNGYNWNLHSLLYARATHHHLRQLIDALEHVAQREPQWSQLDRYAIAETLRDYAREQRRLVSLEELELFPEILAHLEPTTLAELTARLARFDSQSEAWAPTVNVGDLCRGIVKRCINAEPEALGVPSGSARGRPHDRADDARHAHVDQNAAPAAH